MSTQFSQTLGNNDDETELTEEITAVVEANERGVLIELHAGNRGRISEVFVELFGTELRVYTNTNEQLDGDGAMFVLEELDRDLEA